ncbi:MAG: TIGR03013 family PEP-CTERM/XrtA system glycosyltransferase [bacterium]|nr:TIGR03013 family PEP-CTERM/XrtA system glycosyltransferase [bacterium]
MTTLRIAKPRFLAYFALEGGLIFAVLYGLAWLTLLISRSQADLTTPVVACGVLFSAVLLVTQAANLGHQASLKREILLYTILCVVLGAIGFLALYDHRPLPALLVAQGAVAVPVAVAAWRVLSVRYRVFNPSRERVLIVGTGEIARQVCRWIADNHAADFAVVGFADEVAGREGTVLAMGARIQTDYAQLARFAPSRADRVIVALDEKRGKLPVRPLMELRLLGVEIEEATSFFERISGKIAVETMLPSWLIFSEGFKASALRSILKRAADLALASILLVLTTPLMAFTAMLVALDSGFPVLYRQSRLGRDGKEFNLLKFRSMRQDAEKAGPSWTRSYDPRVTRVGSVIRVLRIDELPQLINVLKGEMSFVGPRPERGHFVKQLEEVIPYYGLRTTMRPGLTGWAQVEYGYGSTVDESLEKLKYDLYYIKNNNLLLDMWIVLKTVKVVLTGRGR